VLSFVAAVALVGDMSSSGEEDEDNLGQKKGRWG
jgi:hypothetical protein